MKKNKVRKYPVKFYWKRSQGKSKLGKWRLYSRDAYGDHSSSITIQTNIGFEMYIPDPAGLSYFTAKPLRRELGLNVHEEIWSRFKIPDSIAYELGVEWKRKILSALDRLMKKHFGGK